MDKSTELPHDALMELRYRAFLKTLTEASWGHDDPELHRLRNLGMEAYLLSRWNLIESRVNPEFPDFLEQKERLLKLTRPYPEFHQKLLEYQPKGKSRPKPAPAVQPMVEMVQALSKLEQAAQAKEKETPPAVPLEVIAIEPKIVPKAMSIPAPSKRSWKDRIQGFFKKWLFWKS